MLNVFIGIITKKFNRRNVARCSAILFISVSGVLQAPILRPPSLFTIKTKKRIQRCAALYPQNNRSVTDVGTLPTSFQPKHLDFSQCKYTNFFYIAVVICFFFAHSHRCITSDRRKEQSRNSCDLLILSETL